MPPIPLRPATRARQTLCSGSSHTTTLRPARHVADGSMARNESSKPRVGGRGDGRCKGIPVIAHNAIFANAEGLNLLTNSTCVQDHRAISVQLVGDRKSQIQLRTDRPCRRSRETTAPIGVLPKLTARSGDNHAAPPTRGRMQIEPLCAAWIAQIRAREPPIAADLRAIATGVPTTLCDRRGDLTIISRLPGLSCRGRCPRSWVSPESP
jgi:hypothetical protein